MEEKKIKGKCSLKTIGKAYFLIVFLIVFVHTIFFGSDKIFYKHKNVETTKENTVSVISVGQAESILISSNGHFCLIDAGEKDLGHDKIIDYLNSKGVKEIDLLVITHFHDDHFNQVLNVLDNFEVKKILIPNAIDKNRLDADIYDILKSRAENGEFKLCTAMKNNIFLIGNGMLKVLEHTYNNDGVNNTSVATLFMQDGFTFLNTGDGDSDYEKRLLECFSNKVTLFTAGHHGASNANTEEFLKAIQPDFVAISAGIDNEYGHPHTQAIENFEKYAGQYNVTAIDGTLVYSMDTKQLISN